MELGWQWLKYFYRIVGSCNFCWDHEANAAIPWEGADPLDIPPLKDLIEMVNENDDDVEYGSEGLLISGDYLTNQNTVITLYPSIPNTKLSVIFKQFLSYCFAKFFHESLHILEFYK